MLLNNDTLYIHLNIAFNVQTKHLFNYYMFIYLNGNSTYVKDTIKGQIPLR
jgi:hypothetical protein